MRAADVLPALAPLVILLVIGPGLIMAFSRLSGWKTLSDRYPCRTELPERRRRFGYGVFRGWIGYNGGLVVSADARGFYLAAMSVLLSFCHAPIFIPWSEVTEIRRRRIWLRTCYQISARRAPEVDFALRRGTFAFVAPFAERAGVRIRES